MGEPDYYGTLGVPRGATKDEIKRAYRRLAKKHHPDLNKENPKASEEKCKQVSEAYEALVDEDKRRIYDEYGAEGLRQQVWGGEGFDWSRFTHASDIEDIFGRDFFSTFFGPAGGGGRPRVGASASMSRSASKTSCAPSGGSSRCPTTRRAPRATAPGRRAGAWSHVPRAGDAGKW